MKVLCVIPARYASTRLPGKPLSLIAGKPMIQHVYERACQAKLPDEVVVAADNELVKKAVDGFGGKAMMTSPDHPSGTDRLAAFAGERGADVALYGHTHRRALTRGQFGTATVFNPGSLYDDGSYGVIEIQDGGCKFGWKRLSL